MPLDSFAPSSRSPAAARIQRHAPGPAVVAIQVYHQSYTIPVHVHPFSDFIGHSYQRCSFIGCMCSCKQRGEEGGRGGRRSGVPVVPPLHPGVGLCGGAEQSAAIEGKEFPFVQCPMLCKA